MANTHSLSLVSASTQYGSVSDSASLSETGDLTIEAWVKPTTLPSVAGNNYAVVSKFITTAHRSYRLYVTTNDKAAFVVSGDGATTTFGEGNTPLLANQWTYIAGVYTAVSGQVIFYQNGTAEGTTTGFATSIFDGTAPLLIGAVDPTPTQLFNGLVDECRLSDAARSAAYIGTAYNVEVGTDANHIALYRFNQTALDATGNANDLTLVNSPVYSTDIPFGRASSGLQNKIW